MTLDKVQNWALVKFGPYSHEYAQVVAALHPVEEFGGNLIRILERHSETLDLGVSLTYYTRLKKNPQERIP